MNRKKSESGKDVGGIFQGLADLVDRLGRLAETSESLKRSGTFESSTENGEKIRGRYGVSVRFGLGEDSARVTPVTEPADKREERETRVKEVIDPPVDIFPSDEGVQVIAGVPGVSLEDVELQLYGDVLIIQARNGPKHYHKEMVLPFACRAERITSQCNNGILEINLLRTGDSD